MRARHQEAGHLEYEPGRALVVFPAPPRHDPSLPRAGTAESVH
jgi:hypothetical protein